MSEEKQVNRLVIHADALRDIFEANPEIEIEIASSAKKKVAKLMADKMMSDEHREVARKIEALVVKRENWGLNSKASSLTKKVVDQEARAVIEHLVRSECLETWKTEKEEVAERVRNYLDQEVWDALREYVFKAVKECVGDIVAEEIRKRLGV